MKIKFKIIDKKKSVELPRCREIRKTKYYSDKNRTYLCSQRAGYFINGKYMCRQHAGKEALRMLEGMAKTKEKI